MKNKIIVVLLVAITLFACSKRRDKRLYGCVYNVATDKTIPRKFKINLKEEKKRDFIVGLLSIGQTSHYTLIQTIETSEKGCFDEVIEFEKKTSYEIEIENGANNTVWNYNYEYSSIKDLLTLNDTDEGSYNHDKMNVNYKTLFSLDKDEFKKKNKELEINFSTVLYGKLIFVLNNTNGADSITVHAKNPYFEDIIFSNSNLSSKTSKEYMLPVCPITLRYEVIKNGVVTTTTEEILIKEDELITITHNY